MDGSNRQNDNYDDNKYRYHGRRRNAYANLKLHKNPRANDDYSGESTTSTFHRTQDGGIRIHRNPKFQTTQSKFKLNKNINKWKDEEDDTIMRNQTEGTSTGLQQERPAREQYRPRPQRGIIHRRFQSAAENLGRIVNPKETKVSYKIGDNNEMKQFTPTKSHCKLNNMQQDVFDLVLNFLKQYFDCYDKKRDDLIYAYHTKALFSLSLNVNSPATVQSAKFGSYFKESRNLKHVHGNERVFKMLHIGNKDIAEFISKMPPSEHDLDSLKLDSCYFMQNMLTFSVIGTFKETTLKDKDRRSFQRVFVCIPTANSQMVIVNEQFTISNLSSSQKKIYGKEENGEAANIETNTPIAPITITISNVPDQSEQMKLNMINELSKITNLKSQWSKDILEYAKWNFEDAKKNFYEHKSQIPQDAYI